jgi:quinol-cytochrome oxidoreductase complex cytochrome b subunit
MVHKADQSKHPPAAESTSPPSGLSRLVLHLHPKMVPARTLPFTHTFGLGGMCVILVLLLVATGVLLLFVYEPSVSGAYESVASLRHDVPMGQFVRNAHRWSGNALLILAVLHLLRVFYTGAYRGPRAKNWIIGLVLLALVVLGNFTGYLLPWDQLAFWAVTIATSMLEYVPLAGPILQKVLRGGDEVGAPTLATFFVLHIVIVPVAILPLMAAHFWLVRKAHGVIVPRGEGEADPGLSPLVPTSPNLTAREAAVALVLVAVILAFAVVVNAPLEGPANPGLSPNPAKAPWYFMGLQELLVHFHPLVAVLAIPLAGALLLVRLPAIDAVTATEGTWFLSARGRRTALSGAAFGSLVTIAAVLLDEYVLDLPGQFPAVPSLVTAGLFPVALFVAIGWIFLAWLRRGGATAAERTQALCTALLAAMIVLTIVGAGFRGRGMALTWPTATSSTEGESSWR